MIRKLSLTVAAVVFAASPVLADTYVIDKNHSDASFQVRHMMSRVRGQFNDYAGSITVDPARPESASVEFTLKAASIDTANDSRDKDLRSANFFDVEKFPEITFKSTKVKTAGKDKYDVTGTLTIHGVAKEVTLPVQFLGFGKDPWGNEKAGFAIDTTLNRKDFGIVWNKTLDSGGVLLGDEVWVSINLETAKKKEAASN
ncbi:MAG TPA: YceI family protein [Vicinamibacteria bacterium]|jgi:polyisoprenoid-binding protein YceI